MGDDVGICHMCTAGWEQTHTEARKDEEVIYEIEEALKRIERGTYGVCELTGKPIPQPRLTAIPWTRFRVDAQSELERYGAVQNRSLGQLGTITTPGAASKDKVEAELPEPKSKKE